ncbi:restriction endonuclease subunit S [Pseudomonas aeruginosa]|uniref:restriction endonuclease subunit S n=1 Tax=Pseudomonas aeruginosa TaxID=287 RepID=UPI00073E0BA8|nr:restriction endonuclease subunit S [Pseudomonas aeruginosa]ALV81221.1 Type I restriction modification DNA specificity domain protein [Pseudomonas aeruginosa]EKW0328928.1 restriction endonuclease subunit S [Pseudomonas aeruginosa]EKW2708443.1 restriction endonuclease subunit S [Pseudomonas aeruginosa]EKW3862847.1 restriction endonuclease subunit S [Pseudomonas aeruginosa]MBC9042661.1 restriction endonuclease subunit S [Pseudomonas aeruginosa]
MSWPRVKLSDVATINPRLPRDVDESQQVTFVAMASASEDGHLLASEARVLSETQKGFTYFDRSDVLLAKITPCFENGKCLRPGQIPTEIGFGSTEFHVIRPDTESLDSLYLFYLVWSEQFRFLGEKSMSGAAGQKRVGSDFLKGFEIPLPPLPEQKRIAAILDKADAIRRKRQQAIQLADDFLRAVFLDMFGDPVTNPKGWPLKRFGEIGTWASGGTPSRAVADFFEGDINWYSAGELNSRYLEGSVEKISASAIKNSAAKIFKKGSLLVGMYDTAAMKISILREDSSCNQACANVECNELASVEWLYSYIDCAKDSYLSLRRGVRQKNLNLGMIRDFQLPLPPRELQDEFVTFVSAVLGMKMRQEECKDFPVFESLSQKAFRGEL